jgi:hypothetical protein
MPAFQQKLHRFVGAQPVAALARRIAMEASTLQRWLSGQSPTLSALKALAETTGIPTGYWADDQIRPIDFSGPEGGSSMAARVRAHLQPTPRCGTSGAVVPDADDPRALEVSGQGLPFPGARTLTVVYDAGRPGRARDGDLVVAEIAGEFAVGWRHTAGQHRSYQVLDAGRPPALSPVERVSAEWPVVAVILRSRREHARAVERAEGEYKVAEEHAPYARSGMKKALPKRGTGRSRRGKP